MTDVISVTEQVILNQPQDMAKTLKKLEKTLLTLVRIFEEANNIFLCGCGDSYFASIYGMHTFEFLTDLRAYAENSYEFLKYRRNLSPGDILIAVSASGHTAKTVDALIFAKKKKLTTIALTNMENSPLAENADYIILTHATSSPSPTSTTTTAMLSLVRIAAEISRNKEIIQEISKIPQYAEFTIRKTLEKKSKFTRLLKGKTVIHFVGEGPHFSAALIGAAKSRELCWIHGIAFEAEEFCHYPLISLEKDDIVIISAWTGQEKIKKIIEATKEIGLKTIVICDEKLANEIKSKTDLCIELPFINTIISPILTAISMQLLMLEYAKNLGRYFKTFRYAHILANLIGYY